MNVLVSRSFAALLTRQTNFVFRKCRVETQLLQLKAWAFSPALRICLSKFLLFEDDVFNYVHEKVNKRGETENQRS